jgi:hypothetical protein
MSNHNKTSTKKANGSRLTLLSLLTIVNLNNTDSGSSTSNSGGGSGGNKGPFQNQISIYKALKLNDDVNHTK